MSYQDIIRYDEYNTCSVRLDKNIEIHLNIKKLHSKLLYSVKPINDEYYLLDNGKHNSYFSDKRRSATTAPSVQSIKIDKK